jgi:hypothetical protein
MVFAPVLADPASVLELDASLAVGAG